MPFTLILHIQGIEPVVGEADEIPPLDATLILIHNPRRVDGKDLSFLADNVVTMMWPVDKINFIEIQSGEEEDRIIGFVRE